MRYQIALVGSQLLPVYLGIMEFNPDKVFFIVSDQSRSKVSLIKSCMPSLVSSEWNCDAYSFHAVKNTCERILEKLTPEDELVFNLTGGTKIMMLAAHTVMHERKKTGFYINQDNTLVRFPSLDKEQVQVKLTTKEFLSISGHLTFTAKTLKDFDDEDIRVCKLIDTFSTNEPKKYSSILSYFRNYQSNHRLIPEKGNTTLANGIEIIWGSNVLTATIKGKQILKLKSYQVADIFFNAGWWELLVAQQIAKWDKVKELFVKCELPFRSDKTTMKNEIDILINVGNKLIFVECKSGNVKQEDINKMRVIKQTYGGAISKSILVSRYLPSTTILEKCKELDIEVFYCFAFQQREVNSLTTLVKKIDELEKKLFA